MPLTEDRVSGAMSQSPRSPAKPWRMPTTSHPRLADERTVVLMTAFRPGASPPPVSRPMRISCYASMLFYCTRYVWKTGRVLPPREDVLHLMPMTSPSTGRVSAIWLAMALSIALFVAVRSRSGEAKEASLAFSATAPSGPAAFVGVTVVPMDRNRVIPDQTVLVRDG